ncbi:MAG TPA: hypothetical protein VMV49_15370 [Candidatus Deferrimicrobium sp.]|nr:hypothetical protein [Candidatus Deferrimicrobium sp.]
MTQISNLYPILIERGSYMTHCGYAGNDKAEQSFRTPMIDVEEQFENIFKNVLKVDPSQHNIIIIKDAGTAQQVLKEEACILFTKFNVKACAFVNSQIGVLFTWVGKGPNALIVDIGYESTIILPIIDLRIKKDLIAKISQAGRTIENFIIDRLINLGISMDLIEKHKDELFPRLLRDYFFFDSESEHDFERTEIYNRKKDLSEILILQDKEGNAINISLPSPILPLDLVLKRSPVFDMSLSALLNTLIVKILETFGASKLGRIIDTYDDQSMKGRIIITGGASNILGLRSLLIRELLKKTDIRRAIDFNNYPKCPLILVELGKGSYAIRCVPYESTPGSWIGASMIFSLKNASKFFVLKEEFSNNPEINFPLEHQYIR